MPYGEIALVGGKPFGGSDRQRDAGDTAQRHAYGQTPEDAGGAGLCHRTRLALLAAAALDPKEIARVEQERTGKTQQEIRPAHGRTAKAAEMQREEGCHRREPRPLPPRHIVGASNRAGARVDLRPTIGRRAHPIARIDAGDVAVRTVLCIVAIGDRAKREAGCLGRDAPLQLGGRQRALHRLERGRPRRSGPQWRAPLDPGRTDLIHRALHVVDLVVEGEDDGGYRHHDVKRQTEQPEQIVQVEPHPLDVLAEAQREQVLHQTGQQTNDAGDDRHGVEQRDHAHNRHRRAAADRQADLLVEHVDELRDR